MLGVECCLKDVTAILLMIGTENVLRTLELWVICHLSEGDWSTKHAPQCRSHTHRL